MKQVLSANDILNLMKSGRGLQGIGPDAILTPSARDVLREHRIDLDRLHSRTANGAAPAAAPAPGSSQKPSVSIPDLDKLGKDFIHVTKDSPAEKIQEFFNCPQMQSLKEQICDVGRRLWSRAYVDGNGGNIAIRVANDLALCTPTLVSKGFMKPEDLCLVDLDGNQLAGKKKRTSEILMHLQIMKKQPKAKATVHCHPPHATAFAVAGVEPPTCMIPEIEVFIGKVPIAPYRTPGSPEMGQLVSDLVDQHNTVLMANHGVVSWSHLNVEDAYFKMEIVEAYCRTVWVASHLSGGQMKTFSPGHLKDLLNIKQGLGIPDPRQNLKECELCDNSEWRPGVVCAVPSQAPASSGNSSPASGSTADPDLEKLVQTITDQILGRK
jgi:L-fuculose-phosphate aldolase